VNWLTDASYTMADAATPPQALADALRSSPDQPMLAGLMLMNVAMPAGTALVHQRMGNAAGADASRLTARRAMLLLRAMLPTQPALAPPLAALRAAVAAALGDGGGAGEADPYWADFLVRWGYDQEQLELIRVALAECEV